ncbi:MAG: hypothetical protein IMY84_00660 [Chloroflexi bacterium]|nr:hypothetical protein [Chloroflexota bacterium]
MSDDMDLSPIARERLARIGELSATEQRQMQREKELEHALSAYFLGDSDVEGLWRQLKSLSESHGSEVPRAAQTMILATLRLQMSDDDFARRKDALLAIETLKGSDKYSAIELLLGSIASLRERYDETRQQAYDQLREQVEGQVKEAAEQARMQGVLVDSAGSVDARIKNSPEWRDFMMRQDAAGQQTFRDYITRLTALL